MKNNRVEHLYVHWPFCKNKCHYCDFTAFERHEAFTLEYHQALMKEMDAYFSNPEYDSSHLRSVFFGGGTPSLYPLSLLEECTEKIFSYSDRSLLEEMTLEVNPQGVDQIQLESWKAFGFNRVSIGVQILHDLLLKKLNRRQTTADVLSLFDKVFHYFSNVSVDLIIGLPGATEEDWWNTLHTILQWPVQHISIYFLTVHEHTPLAHRLQTKELALPSDDAMVDLYQKTIALLFRHGLMQYEISNFARPGKESIHNYAYWQRKWYKGLGIGASSFYQEVRTVNQKNLTAYLQQWNEGIIQTEGKTAPFQEVLTLEQQRLERYMLGLRQVKGISFDELFNQVDREKKEKIKEELAFLEEAGFLQVVNDVVQLTPRGMVYENEIVTKLY
jgi:oxygen-independent coproporphyrinogen-3 oxidase